MSNYVSKHRLAISHKENYTCETTVWTFACSITFKVENIALCCCILYHCYRFIIVKIAFYSIIATVFRQRRRKKLKKRIFLHSFATEKKILPNLWLLKTFKFCWPFTDSAKEQRIWIFRWRKFLPMREWNTGLRNWTGRLIIYFPFRTKEIFGAQFTKNGFIRRFESILISF